MIENYYSYDNIDNVSDHIAVSCSINIPICHSNNKVKKMFDSGKVNWYKATDVHLKNYGKILKEKLLNISNSFSFNECELNCNSSICKDKINRLYNDIVCACEESSIDCIPRNIQCTNFKEKKIGWNEIVEPKRQRALLWHSIWLGSDSPRYGYIADIRRKTRSEYHKAIRFRKNNEKAMMYKKLANSLINNSSKVFWKEINRIKGVNNDMPSIIDGLSDNKMIANLFANNFSEIYNSVPYDEIEFENLRNEIDNKINNKCLSKNCLNHVNDFTVLDISNAIKMLKKGKADGNNNLFSDHFINAPIELHSLLALLFNQMLYHGFSPLNIANGTIIPIPKVKNTCDSSQFRSITLGSIPLKILELMILDICKKNLASCDQQFGYKKNSSTASCTFVVQEVVSYFNSQGSSVYATLLDASKAFDRVEYCTLFNILLKENICPTIIRLILFI